ncbi:MOSC domain-containing protein [Andreprevotia chitinilytica]|uniref:MOSC domain-containing protein n=1 Tax=Andreprevotia chitinilytica TaxID=396808 RepID=UPI00054E0147|nr:MOSC domain-containing protein [Andreprevotia chitinilytica]
MTITLTALYRYPVKSTRAHSLVHTQVTPLGLPDDRAWMVADATGRFITGRELPHFVRVVATPTATGLILSAAGFETIEVACSAFTTPQPVQVWRDHFEAWIGATDADAWLSAVLGQPVQLVYTGDTQRRVKHHPDVPLSFADGYPILLAGEASRQQLSGWVGRDMEMARFRPNLVVSGADAFAEDGWKRIRIGDVTFRIVKPCARCVFTTVDPETGEKSADQEPMRALAKHRKGDGGVMFGQNVIAENAGQIAVGMPVEILELA